ncbi:MAG TPA: hypothetical protein VH740_12045 [Vicinamibacterales bacterium]
MRPRAALAAMFALLILDAAPAAAQGWRWLEKLSGPGDFYGYEIDLKLLCGYEGQKKPERTVGISLPCVKRKPVRPLRTKADDIGAIVDDGKNILDLSRRVYATGVGLSYLRGGGDLEYFPTATHVDRTVQVWAIEGFFDHRVGDTYIDVGVAVGANIFVVPEAEKLTRWSIEPRVTLKLFDLRRRSNYVGTASLRLGVLAFFKEFTAEDFGAIPGTYRSGTEIGPSFRLILDFDRNPFK